MQNELLMRVFLLLWCTVAAWALYRDLRWRFRQKPEDLRPPKYRAGDFWMLRAANLAFLLLGLWVLWQGLG